jgi:hypothetical protein
MEVKRVGMCAIVVMKGGENRVDATFIKSFHAALDAVEK